MEYSTQKIRSSSHLREIKHSRRVAEPFQQMHQQLVGNEKVSLGIQG